jgi:spore coat protein A, manganese oxidase
VTLKRSIKGLCWASLVAGLLVATTASAQIPYTPLNTNPNAANAAFALQNPLGPATNNYQVNYPYPGQCLAGPQNGLFPTLQACTAAGSFAATSTRTAGGWAAGGLVAFTPLNPVLPNSAALGNLATPKFVWDVLNPIDYTPDTATYPGADYYELGVHEAWGFQGIATAGLFPNPATNPAPWAANANAVPGGMQWTGLTCNNALGCSCPADASPAFRAAWCTAGGKVPAGAPLLTPIWGIGQINSSGGPVTATLASLGLFAPGPASAWSANAFVATWPSISIRGTKGRPVVVKWVNEFPNNHVLCPHPEAADWPCSIDRTFMGVKAKIDPALTAGTTMVADGVNAFGSPQQPDNSWVTHFHGGEIPPSTDGFAEKWFGNAVTAAAYAGVGSNYINPPFENPSGIALKRPAASFDTYSYPMVQEEATVWFHDHTLGKTHHNVIAGPAGFFPVREPAKHGGVGTGAGVCPTGYAGCTSEYTWVDPLSEPRGFLGTPLYDLFFAIQDRAFNDDGSINFSNGLGQLVPPGGAALLPIGFTPVTSGANPQVHPVWVPEYFGDHLLVNGVLWPKYKAAPGWYRIRVVDGSDSRCYTSGFSTVLPARGAKPNNNLPFYVIASDQGYYKNPVLTSTFTMCPGERYELLVNFGALPKAAMSVYMTNSAPAPFPAGVTPFAQGSPDAEMNVIMRFDVSAANGVGVKSCAAGAVNNWDPTWTPAQITSAITSGAACIPANPALIVNPFVDIRPTMPFPPGTIVRQVYFNEKVDGVTASPLGMQINGVPFEYKVTETPKKGTKEVWQFVNLTADTHPMHPHLVKHLIVSRQAFNVGAYKALLCGSPTCQPGPAPGGEMQVIPDVTRLLMSAPALVTAASVEGGYKDATQAPPGQVTTIVAEWTPRWTSGPPSAVNAPGAGNPNNNPVGGNAAQWVFEDVTAGPYVWHCHINSHEDSEMMHTSLVVP